MFWYDTFRSDGGRVASGQNCYGGIEHRPCVRRDQHCYERAVLQIVYGRSQSAFSEEGLPVGAGLEDLGKGLRSQVGTMYGTLKKGPRYLEMAEGYVTGIALDT